MSNNIMKKLLKLEGALQKDRPSPFDNVLKTSSPSVNFTFGKTHGLPRGMSLVMYGKPKGGKSLIANMMIGELHKSDPEAIVIKFDTEFRSAGQLDGEATMNLGIDPDRLAIFEVNKPGDVFDRIETEVAALAQENPGKIGLVIIDSINGIQGLRASAASTLEDDQKQIGDVARTIQTGLKRILPVQRKHNFSVVLVAQARAEMNALEIQRGNDVKMGASYGTQHYAEYFMYVEENRNKAGRSGLMGNAYEDADLKDMMGKTEKTGHKIRATMIHSSMGPKGRTGEFSIDYNRGIVDVHEEVFSLATVRGVITRTGLTYSFGEHKWKGKAEAAKGLYENPSVQAEIIKELIRRDMSGEMLAPVKTEENTVIGSEIEDLTVE